MLVLSQGPPLPSNYASLVILLLREGSSRQYASTSSVRMTRNSLYCEYFRPADTSSRFTRFEATYAAIEPAVDSPDFYLHVRFQDNNAYPSRCPFPEIRLFFCLFSIGTTTSNVFSFRERLVAIVSEQRDHSRARSKSDRRIAIVIERPIR